MGRGAGVRTPAEVNQYRAGWGRQAGVPPGPVVVVVGDDGLLFMAEELTMAGQHKAAVVIRGQQRLPGIDPAEPEVCLRLPTRGQSLVPRRRGPSRHIRLIETFGVKGERVIETSRLVAVFA